MAMRDAGWEAAQPGQAPAVNLTYELESTLVTQAVRRNTEAFGELFNRYFERIFLYARLRLAHPADAEDVASAVFLSAWRTIDHFVPQHEASFAAWLFRLAHNHVIDRYRNTHEAISLDAQPEIGISLPTYGIDDAEARLDMRLTLLEVRGALQQLTEEQREVVLLRFVEGLSAREVGAILGKQEGTVRGLQFRA